MKERVNLEKYAWLAIGAAILTISLKGGAAWITGSVGLLSDAAESCVNLIAAIVALIALKVAASPADDGHHFGHGKAEYFSAAIEGAMILLAAVVIIYEAVRRIMNPQPLDNVTIGVVICVLASLINGGVAYLLMQAGKKHRSLTLTADGKHLLTDVWTSVGVIVGVIVVLITKVAWLDPVIALAVGLNIIWTGVQLMRRSADGLLDAAMSNAEHDQLTALIKPFAQPGTIDFHGLRTRVSGQHRFVELHVLVPSAWTVKQGHDLCVKVEERIKQDFDSTEIMCHLEPIEDPQAYDDAPHRSVSVSSEPTPDTQSEIPSA